MSGKGEIFSNGGEMGERVRAFDWAATPLGPVEDWPQSLLTAVAFVLERGFPMIMFWGSKRTVAAYNDAYRPLLDHKPEALGRDFLDVWDEAREITEPQIGQALDGQTVTFQKAKFELYRDGGSPEEAWFDYYFSPLHDETGAVAGVLNETLERTSEVQAERKLRESARRQAFLVKLGDAMRSQAGAQAKIEVASRLLGEHLDASRVMLAEYDHEAGLAHIFDGWFADGAKPFPEVMALAAYEGPILQDLRAGRNVKVENARDAAQGRADLAAIAELGVEALLSVPHLKDGVLKVNLSVHQHAPRRWTETEVSLVQEAAERVGAAIEQARVEEALRRSEEKYRSLFEKMDEAYAVVEVLRDETGRWSDFRFLEVNPSFVEHTAMPWPVGKTATELLGSPNPRWTELYGQALDTGESIRVEEEEGTLGRTFDLNIFTLDRAHNTVAVLFHDITARKRAERHRILLVRELNHRVKNTLAVVQAIAHQTFAGEARDALRAFEDRLGALARAHDLLTRGSWSNASLRDLVETTAATCSGAEFVIDGPEVLLPPQASVSLSMALHELCTNAMKYGSLSNEEGCVRVEWTIAAGDPPRLELEWREEGGPPVSRPQQRGFGSRLIEQALASELGGRVELAFLESGLVCRVEAPLESEGTG